MNKSRQHPGLLGGIGIALAAGLVLYRGCYS